MDMSGPLDIIFGFFQNPVLALLSIGLGYFVCLHVKKKFNIDGDFDKFIFSSITGVLLYSLSMLIFGGIFYTFGLFTFETVLPLGIATSITGWTFLFLIAFLYCDFVSNSRYFEYIKQVCCVTGLIFILYYGIFLVVLAGVLRSSYYVLFWKFFGVAIFSLILLIPSTEILKDSIKTNRILDNLSKIYSKTTLKKVGLTFVTLSVFSFLILPIVFFPQIDYNQPEQIISYTMNLSDRGIAQPQLAAHVVQPIELKSFGVLHTLFIENKGKWDDFVVDIPDGSCCTITANGLNSGLRKIGFTSVNYSENYSGFVLQFGKLNESKLRGVSISGDKIIPVSKEDFYFRIERIDMGRQPYEVNLSAMDDLGAKVLYNIKQDIMPFSGNCSMVSNSSIIRMYNITSKEIIETRELPSAPGYFRRVMSDGGDYVFTFQLEGNVLYFSQLDIPPHTNLTVSFKVLCN